MPEMKRATETFAWSGGLVHWGSEAEVVKAFPDFFEPVPAEGEEPASGKQPTAAKPAKKAQPKKAAGNG